MQEASDRRAMGLERRSLLLGSGTLAAGLAGCTTLGSSGDASIDEETLRLSTTTSTYDTGLLDEVNLAFEDRFGARVETVAQGTGAALETARNGDTDVVLVHARSLEDDFLEDGTGINRRDLLFNDFVVVGEPTDPAGVREASTPAEAFEAIAADEETFVSRGDESGTHLAELDVWAETSVDDRGSWYREAGAGMGEVLVQVAEDGYTLADRGTVISMRSELDLEILLEGPLEGGPEKLANPYGIMAVNPAVHDHVAYDLAMAYIGFFTGPAGQEIVDSYTVDGEQVFQADALPSDPAFEQYVPEGWQP